MPNGDPPERVEDIGEQGLLARLQRFCPPAIVGDDAALLSLTPGQSLVVTSDVLVDGVHFSDRTTTAQDAGWRAAAANLSDLAAMGANPLGITVGLALPPTAPVTWVEQLYQGMAACLELYQTPIVGGDLCRSSVITVAITALGQVSPSRAIRRATAVPGDAIVVTGFHGGSRAGLELLLHPASGQHLAEVDRVALIQTHQRPQPRLDVLTQLPDARPYSISGMDSSDGLADAVLQICRASRVGARLHRQQIPIHPALLRWQPPSQALEWALYGGEDFELVLCLPPEPALQFVAALGTGAAIVGHTTREPGVYLVDETGQFSDQALTLEQGFQHFKD